MQQLYAYVADETALGVFLLSTIYSVEKICMHWYYLGLKSYEKESNIQHSVLLWNSQNREYQKYSWNVIVLWRESQ